TCGRTSACAAIRIACTSTKKTVRLKTPSPMQGSMPAATTPTATCWKKNWPCDASIVHHVPQRLPAQCSQATLGAFAPHVGKPFFTVKRGVRVEDHSLVSGMLWVFPGRDHG